MRRAPVGAGFTIDIPERTPSGAPIAIEEDERDGHRRLHAQGPGGAEVYVEVLASPGTVDHEEAVRNQVADLSERAPGARFAGPSTGTVAGRSATVLDFTGELGGVPKVRRFAFVDAAGRTFRIVHDPSSAANAAILDTLELPAG